MREIAIRKLILEMKYSQLPSCFGSKEFNEGCRICKACDQLEECKRKLNNDL